MEKTKPRLLKRSLKIMGTAAAIAVGLIVLAITVAEPVLNSSAFKSRLENTIGELLDMRFSIEGSIKLGFMPLLSVVANNLSVSTSNGKIAHAYRIEIDFSLPDLIFLKVHLEDLLAGGVVRQPANDAVTHELLTHLLGKVVSAACPNDIEG